MIQGLDSGDVILTQFGVQGHSANWNQLKSYLLTTFFMNCEIYLAEAARAPRLTSYIGQIEARIKILEIHA